MDKIILDLQIATSDSNDIPSQDKIQQWLTFILPQFVNEAELTIRIVDEQESQYLNNLYRHKDRPTNVLSFPFESPVEKIGRASCRERVESTGGAGPLKKKRRRGGG